MKIRYVAYIIPLAILIFISWILCGTPSVRKGTHYLIADKKESYVFVVTEILHERYDGFLLESIKYKLYPKGSEIADSQTSFIKYRSTKRGEHSNDLKKIEGTTKIAKGSIVFTWSYKSEDQIYLYLEDDGRIKRLRDV